MGLLGFQRPPRTPVHSLVTGVSARIGPPDRYHDTAWVGMTVSGPRCSRHATRPTSGYRARRPDRRDRAVQIAATAPHQLVDDQDAW
jgi:hypothetical protein